MRSLTRSDDGQFRKIAATGLVPLLLVLPGCVARHMPDWSRVQGVKPDTQTEVQLYKEAALQGSRKMKGRFVTATDRSVTLKLKNGQTETFQRKYIRKVLAYRKVGKRWPGWIAAGIAFAVGGNAFRSDADFTPAAEAFWGVALPIGIAIPFFFGSKMGGVYEVPPNQRDWYPQGAGSPASETKKPEDSR